MVISIFLYHFKKILIYHSFKSSNVTFEFDFAFFYICSWSKVGSDGKATLRSNLGIGSLKFFSYDIRKNTFQFFILL